MLTFGVFSTMYVKDGMDESEGRTPWQSEVADILRDYKTKFSHTKALAAIYEESLQKKPVDEMLSLCETSQNHRNPDQRKLALDSLFAKLELAVQGKMFKNHDGEDNDTHNGLSAIYTKLRADIPAPVFRKRK